MLASASPRRLELLRQIGIEPVKIDPADTDETPYRDEPPRAYAERMARAKLAVVAPRHPQALVLAADSVVAVGRRILPKAETKDEALRCLKLLSGRRHRVLGGLALAVPGGKVRTRLVETVVRFKRLEPAEKNAVDAARLVTAHDLQFDQAAVGGQRHQERLGHDVADQAIDAVHADLTSAAVSNSGRPTTLLYEPEMKATNSAARPWMA